MKIPFETNARILDGKEIDIFISSKNIGFEFNGLYWHSELYKGKMYHQDKKLLANSKGINLIHIWEDDWIFKRKLIESRIKAILGLSKTIYGRKCVIKEISSPASQKFLDINHIQGNINSKYKIGLFYEDKLVAVMTFGTRNKKIEMLRYCNLLDHTIIGGFSKLLKYFIKNYQPDEILSYADLDWSSLNSNVYEKNGFKFKGYTKPGYHWSNGEKRYNRQRFMKYKLVKEGFDSNKTENEIMHDRGFYKIYNSGNSIYGWELK